MKITSLRPANLGIASFLLYAILFIAITLFAAAVLFRGYEVPLRLEMFGITIPPFVYLAAIAFLGFWLQSRISAAYGGGRIADIVVSIPMIAVIVAAFLVWVGFPIVRTVLVAAAAWIGYPIETSPNEYKLTAALLFGFFALLDLGRDWIGIGRRSSMYHGRPMGTATGAFDQAPHEPLELASESGNPFMRTKGPLIVDIDECWVRLPNGRMFQYPLTERLIRRVEWNLADRGLPRPSDTPGGGGADASSS